MKKFTVLKRLAIATSAACLSTAALAADFNLKLHHMLGPKAPAHSKMLLPWAEEIKQATAGRVEIEVFPAMSLGGKPPQLVRQVRDGVVDLVWTVNGYTPGLFPRTEVVELPFVHTNNATATNRAMADMFDDYLAADYTGTKVMFLHVHQGQGIHMVDEALRTPADFVGKKLRIPTRTGAWVIEALGAAPTSMPVPDLPQALSKKVVDGALIPWEIIPPLKLQDLTQYQIEGKDGVRLGTTTFQVTMNQDTWNSFPADIQTAINGVNENFWRNKVGDIWTASDVGGLGVATRAGNTHIELTQAETDQFAEALAPVVDRWVDDVNGKDIDGQKLVETAKSLINKYSN